MKNSILLTTLLLLSGFSLAQNDGFIYTNYEPDLSITTLTAIDEPSLEIDIDGDSISDFKMYVMAKYPTQARFVYVTSTWDFRYCYDTIYPNDTIVSFNTVWAQANDSWELLWEPYNTKYMEFMIGFRKVVNNNSYYAWARIYMYRNINGNGYDSSHGYYDIVSAYVDNTVFCTIPNYPLHWGQTSQNWNVNEELTHTFAIALPNPTDGTVKILGENLRQADVFNEFGQQVSTVRDEGESLQIDLSAQPAGIYFINVTDKEGRKCVRKVVKQ